MRYLTLLALLACDVAEPLELTAIGCRESMDGTYDSWTVTPADVDGAVAYTVAIVQPSTDASGVGGLRYPVWGPQCSAGPSVVRVQAYNALGFIVADSGPVDAGPFFVEAQ